jgi:heptosyltransferase II
MDHRADGRSMIKPERIAVWQTSFLGDAVLTLPLIQNLARRFPGASIDYFVRQGLAELFQPHPDIRKVIAIDKRGQDRGLKGIVHSAARLRRGGYDLLLSPHTSLRTAMVLALSSIPLRIGYDAPWHARLAYHRRVDRRFTGLEEIERVLRLLLPLEVTDPESWPRIALAPSARERALLFRSNIHGPLLGVHPGSVWPTKRWPEERFGQVVRQGLEHGFQVVLFGGPGEEEVVRTVVDSSGHSRHPGLFDLSGRLSLAELAAFIAQLDCYVTNDSGPMHLAWAQHIPVVALFGPTSRSLGFFPRGPGAEVLESGLPCRPCGLHGGNACPEGHHRCMLDIEARTVFERIRDKVAKRAMERGHEAAASPGE